MAAHVLHRFMFICRAWFFISFKNKLVEAVMSKAAKDTIDSDNLARIVSPLSSIITWATVTAAVLASLSALGINVQPVLAFGSVSTLAAGFAAQSTVSNVVSALSLYTARPFISGDRVQLKTLTGALVVSGTVDRVMPLHTIIKCDAGTPM